MAFLQLLWVAFLRVFQVALLLRIRNILSSWILDEAEWPKKRTLKMFREWFDVEYKSMVWDMGNEPLMIEEWEDEGEADNLSDDGSLLH